MLGRAAIGGAAREFLERASVKTLDVVGICNALVDILIEVRDEDIKALGLTKGIMHLVDAPAQKKLLDYFHGKDHAVELGGSAMNAIRTLASLGSKTAFAGMVSEDTFGSRIKSRMQELGITSHLGYSSEPTGSCVILITPDGERTMNTHLGASRLYDDAQVPAEHIRDGRILHFCGYQWDTDGQKTAIRKSVALAKGHETLISFDVADPFVVDRNRDEFKQVIKEDADIVFSNKEEAKMLYGSAEKAAEEITAAGAIAVIKLGSEGAMVCMGKDVHRISAVPTTVVDTTAAGDMFAAGFLFGLASGKSLPVCGQMAATAASDVISRIGARVSEEALKRVKGLG